MCGLVGLISKYPNGFDQVQKDIFSTLLFVDILRGDDSTGAFLIKNNGDLSMAKDSGNALQFLKTKEYDSLSSEAFRTGAALIGHNRKATRGTITDENAHPFIVDDRICLVHNGTLWGDHKQHADVEVDSHAIAHLLAQHDIDAAISKIQGAFALIWYDFQEQALHFLRNKERPLFWVETPSCWLWCSEESMLEFVRHRYDLNFLHKPCQLPEFTLNTFSLKSKEWDVSSRKVEYKYVSTYTGAASNSSIYEDLACAYSQYGGVHDYRRREGAGHRVLRGSGRPRWVANENLNTGGTKPLTQVSGFGDCSVTETEMILGTKSGTLMTVEEFNGINVDYPYNGRVSLTPFDATCVNEHNDKDGMFLWLYAVDDPDVVFRYKFRPNTITEEQAINLVSDVTFYTAVVDTKGWHKVEGTTGKDGSSVGWVLISVKDAQLVQKGITNETIQ